MIPSMRTPFKAYNRLKKSGIPEPQAQSIVEAIDDASDFNLKDLLTKADLKANNAELRTEMANHRTELKTDIADLRTELKADIAHLDTKFSAAISSLQASFHSMQKVLYSGFLILLTTMIATNLHH